MEQIDGHKAALRRQSFLQGRFLLSLCFAAGGEPAIGPLDLIGPSHTVEGVNGVLIKMPAKCCIASQPARPRELDAARDRPEDSCGRP